MSVLADVLRETRTGARPGAVAARLGLDLGLVEAAVDHWVRLGVITPVEALGLGCSGCGTSGSAGAACAGCPGPSAARGGPVPLTLGRPA